MGVRDRNKPLKLMSLVNWSKLEQTTTKKNVLSGWKAKPAFPSDPYGVCTDIHMHTQTNIYPQNYNYKLKIKIRFYLL